jgi:histidinol-phosphate aminotransferase
MAQPLNRYGIEKRILENESGKRKYRQGKMLKKYVRIANAVLDLDPFESGKAAIDNDQIAVGIQRMDRNESSLGPSPKAIEAVKRFLDNRPLSWYPDSETTELNNKISEYTKMPVEYIGCYPGTEAALDYICRTFLEPGTIPYRDPPRRSVLSRD